jgi:hypothetical protein
MNTETLYDPVLRLDGPPSTGCVPAIVDAALARCFRDERRAAALPHRTDAEHAVRAARLAVVADRTARWWEVLARWTYTPAGTVPLVFVHAARVADRLRDDARFWREAAADWTARAEHRPTSDAAGALSNHHELEIAS